MDEKKFVALAEEVIRLKEEIKSINSDIKDSIETFAEEVGFSPKSVKRFIKDYIDIKKDKAEYVEVTSEVDQAINSIFFKEGN